MRTAQKIEAGFSPIQLAELGRLKQQWRSDGSHDQLPNSPQRDFSGDIRFIGELRDRVRRAGIRLQEQDKEGKLQHDMVYDVFTQYKANACAVEDFQSHMQSQLRATVLEQHHAFRNTIQYDIDDDWRLHSAELKNEPVIEAFYRGSHVLGTFREEQEATLMDAVELKAAEHYTDKEGNVHYVTPHGALLIGLSPHDETGRYPDEVMNIFQIYDDVAGRHVILDRIDLKSLFGSFSEEQFIALATEFDPYYYEDYLAYNRKQVREGAEPISFTDYAVGSLIIPKNQLGNNATEVLEHLFGTLPDEEEEKRQYLEFAMPTIRAYINVLTNSDFDSSSSWRELARRKNDIDDIHGMFIAKRREELLQNRALDMRYVDNKPTEWATKNTAIGAAFASGMYRGLSEMPKEQKAAGCGFVSKLEIDGDGSSFGTPSSASKNQFSRVSKEANDAADKNKKEWFKCPRCGWQASGPIGNKPCQECGLTKEAFKAGGNDICD